MNPSMPATSNSTRQLIPRMLYEYAVAGAVLVMMGHLIASLWQLDWILGSWSFPFTLMVVVACMVMVLLTLRREEEHVAFGRAFGLALLVGWFTSLGFNLFILLFFNVFHPEHVEAFVDLEIEQSIQTVEMVGFDVDAFGREKMTSLCRDLSRWFLTPLGQAAHALAAIVWVTFVALIVAFILRRPPTTTAGFVG